jgi:hypothetical protein
MQAAEAVQVTTQQHQALEVMVVEVMAETLIVQQLDSLALPTVVVVEEERDSKLQEALAAPAL